MSDDARLFYEWDETRRSGAEWASAVVAWFGLIAALEPRLGADAWVDLWNDRGVSLDQEVLAARMVEVGTADYHGARAFYATEIDGRQSVADVGEVALNLSVLDVREAEGRANLFVPAPFTR